MNQQVLVPFIKEYCIRCHGAEEQRGDVNFREFQWNVTDDVTAQHWQDVLDVLNSGEMPPEDEKQPAGAKFDKIVKTLTSDLKKAQEILKDSGGAYTIRRLNQREYINTIKHLFGIQVAESFVPDDIRDEHHYDTAEKLQYFDGPLLDQYIEMGITIAEEGIEWSKKPYDTPTVQRHEAESANKDLKKRPIKGYPIDKEGLYMCNGGANHRPVRSISVNHGKDPRAYYKLRVRGAAHDMDAPRRHYLMLRESSAIRS